MSQYASNLGNSSGVSSNASVGPTGSPAPAFATEIGFIASGVLTGVSAATPLPVTIDGGLANPLNVNIADFGGTAVTIGQKLSAASIPVVLASDQSSIPVSSSPNTNGSVSNSTTVTNTSATTFSPPTNAVGFVVEAESSNSVNLRYACGTTATTTVGMLLEPGRDSGYIPSKGTVTVICTTAATNQAASIQWVLSS